MNEPGTIAQMLAGKTVAVIGLSADPNKPSHYVAAYLQRAGKINLPVNPSIEEVLGGRSYPSLSDLPEKPDVVNVFRLPRAIPAIVDEMVALGMTALWVQQGIRNEEAAAHAEAQGISVVMDRCIMVDHRFGGR